MLRTLNKWTGSVNGADDNFIQGQDECSHAQKDVEMKRARLRKRMRLVWNTKWRIVICGGCYPILRYDFLKPPSFFFAYTVDSCPCIFKVYLSSELRLSFGVLSWTPWIVSLQYQHLQIVYSVIKPLIR